MGFHRKPIPEEVQRRITKLFITNLPERCSGWDLAGVLREHGTIYDIFIAKKRDKGGKRFGFVSFLDVKDKEEIIRKMSNIKMGVYKLEINVARFVLEDGEIREEHVHKTKESRVPPANNNGGSNGRFVKKGVLSFKEALTGERRKEDVQNKSIILDDQEPVFKNLHGRSLILKLVSFDVIRNIRKILKDMGLACDMLRYMGGLQVLITFNSKDQATMARDELLGKTNEFLNIHIWDGQEIVFERIAWVKIQGIPIHLMSNDTLAKVANLFGTIVHNPQHEDNDMDLSYYYAGLLVTSGKTIHGEVSIMWKDKLYSVWVNEDSGAWVPDFLISKDNSDSKEKDDSSFTSSEDYNQKNTESEALANDEAMRSELEPELDADIVCDSSELIKKNNNDVFKGSENIGIDLNREVQILESEEEINGIIDGQVNVVVDQTESVLNKNKRKKNRGIVLLGQHSDSYKSSNERPTKESRIDMDDPFGLEPFIWGSGVNFQRGTKGPREFTELNFENHQQLYEDEQPITEDAEHPEAISSTKKKTGAVATLDEEVMETIRLGNLLGVQLDDFQTLVREAIEQEGQQSGFI